MCPSVAAVDSAEHWHEGRYGEEVIICFRLVQKNHWQEVLVQGPDLIPDGSEMVAYISEDFPFEDRISANCFALFLGGLSAWQLISE